MAQRPCLGCGRLSTTSRCTACKRTVERNRQRPSTSARGYGPGHQALRTQVSLLVESGQATCWRCGYPIQPGTPWDLGHDDQDRGRYRGPEHATCNRSAAATTGNRHRARRIR